MDNQLNDVNATVKVYHGYGHKGNLIIYGHVIAGKKAVQTKFKKNAVLNILHLIKLFLIKPLKGVQLRLQWQNQVFFTTTRNDGFFKFQWESDTEVAHGWHQIIVQMIDNQGYVYKTSVQTEKPAHRGRALYR